MVLRKSHPDESPSLPCLRQDLAVTLKHAGNREKVYVVADPVSGKTHDFDEKSFFLCQLFDGLSTPEQVARRYSAFFGEMITREDLSVFLARIRNLNLFAEDAETERRAHKTSAIDDGMGEDAGNGAPDGDTGNETSFEKESASADNPYRRALFDPRGPFALLHAVTRPFRVFFLLLTAGLVPGIAVAFFTYWNNQHLLQQDLGLLRDSGSYIGRLIFTLFSLNLARCLVQGVLITHYRGAVKEFGIRLRFGIIPRFYIDKQAIREFDRHGKLWTYGSNPLFRLFLFVLGTLAWFWFRGTGSQLAANAIVLAQAGIISFLFVMLPIRNSDGFRWSATYFRLPPDLLKTALRIFIHTVTGRPLPTSIPAGKRWRFFGYALFLVVAWSVIFVKVTSHIASGLAESFPDIFGRATQAILLLLVVGLVFRWAWWRVSRFGGSERKQHDVFAPSTGETGRAAQKRLLVLSGVAIVCVLLILPYPYLPGGEVTLLPPKQQNIQAPVSGRIAEVFFGGGDGKKIEQGVILAKMISSELENEIRILEERIVQQEAEVEKRRVQLAKLRSGPRPEEITEMEARLARAAAQVEVARRQLDTAVVAAKFSAKELALVRKLGSSIAALTVEQTRKQMNIDRLTVKEMQGNLTASEKKLDEVKAQLALLTSGPREEDIAIAEQDRKAARAELQQLRQNFTFARAQEENTRLSMPFSGYLDDSYLKQKIGSYLQQGETFAVASNDQRLLVEMDLPEYDASYVEIGTSAEVRLLAYPNDVLPGKVISIQPSSSEEQYGQVFRVLIELPEKKANLKVGMSGYAKIDAGERTLLFLLTRPFMRFVQVEMWSWVP